MTRFSIPRSSISRGLATVLIASLLSAGPTIAASHGRPPGAGGPLGRGKGKLVLVLDDGSLREPSTDRAETTDDPDVLKAGTSEWEVSVASGSLDRVADLNVKSLELVHGEIRHGFGGGLEIGALVESWNRAQIQGGAIDQATTESGYGPTTLKLAQHLAGGTEGHAALAACAHVRLPGASDGPGTRVVEGGVSVPLAIPLGEATRLGMMAESDWVGDANDTGHHLDGVGSLALKRDFGEHLSSWVESVSVWSGESGRAWLGTLNGGLSWDPAPHLGLTVGVSGGVGGGARDFGWLGRMSVHS